MEKGWETASANASVSPRKAMVMADKHDDALGEDGGPFGSDVDTVQTPVQPGILAGVPVLVDGDLTKPNSPPLSSDDPRLAYARPLDDLCATGGVIGYVDDEGAVPEHVDNDGATSTVPFVTGQPGSPAANLPTVRVVVPGSSSLPTVQVMLPSPAANLPTVRVVLEMSLSEFLAELWRFLNEAVPRGALITDLCPGLEGGCLVVRVDPNLREICLSACAEINMRRDVLPRFPEKLWQRVLLIWVEMQRHIRDGANYLCVRGQLPDHVFCELILDPSQLAPVEQVEERSWFSRWRLVVVVAFVIMLALGMFFVLM